MVDQFKELYSEALKRLENLERAYASEFKMFEADMVSYCSCHANSGCFDDESLRDETAEMIDAGFEDFKTSHFDYLDSIEFIDNNVKDTEEDILAKGYDTSEEDRQIASKYEEFRSKLFKDAKATYKMIESKKNRAIASLS